MGDRRYHPHDGLVQHPTEAVAALPPPLEALVSFCRQHAASTPPGSPTPYTGAAGLAFALWRAGSLTGQQAWQREGEQLAAAALRRVRGHPHQFVQESLLDGSAGVVLVNCLMAMARSGPDGGGPEEQALLAAYADTCRAAAQPESGASDKFLYGRAGALFGALLLRHQRGPAVLPDTVVRGLAQQMLASGRSLAARAPVFAASGAPLAYVWPPGRRAEPYLGAAHGLIGILYVLLLAHAHAPGCLDAPGAAAGLDDVRAALRYVLSCECDAPGARAGAGGHYPALMRLQGCGGAPERSTLVHWCHGAPGAVALWCAAHEVLGGQEYLAAALRAGELVWQRGLLTKGPGLCHGVSGNAYALLQLFKATQDPTWLARAQQFAVFMGSDAGRAGWTVPDHPASLFEGLAGGVCLVAELHAAAGGAHAAAGLPLFELVRYV